MKIGVIGAGAVGGLLSAHLAKAGEEVFVVDVDPKLRARAMDKGLSVSGPAAELAAGAFTVAPAAVLGDISEAPALDAVFVCVKTSFQEAVASSLKKTWRPGTILISFQNGIDPEEMLAEVAGRDHTLRAVLNVGCHVVEPGSYSFNWFQPPNAIGALSEGGRPRGEAVAELLTRARLATKAVADIKRCAFEKTALNAALCPVCTLTGQTMGEAMALPETRSLATEILRESMAVARGMGWTFERTMEECLSYLEGGGAHRTSMALDMNAGRKTEIALMNGKICEYGRRLSIPTPYNDAMQWAVVGREQRARV